MKKVTIAKYAGVSVLSLLIGMTMGHASQIQVIHDTQTVTKTVSVPEIKTVTVTKNIPADLTDWQNLKTTDDTMLKTGAQIAQIAGQEASLVSQAAEAGYAGNSDQIASVLAKSLVLNNTVADTASKLSKDLDTRQAILSKLGY